MNKEKIEKGILLTFGTTLSLVGIGTLIKNIANNSYLNFWFFILSSFLLSLGLVLIILGLENPKRKVEKKCK